MNSPTIPLAVLVQALRQAKLAEATAAEHRQEIERQIVARYPAPAGGEGTVKEDEFSIAFKVTRSVDTEGLQNAWATLGTNAEKAIKWKADLDLKQYRAIKDLDPVSFGKLSAFVTTKPAKPALTLKTTEQGT